MRVRGCRSVVPAVYQLAIQNWSRSNGAGRLHPNFAGILPDMIMRGDIKNFKRVETRSNSQKVIDVMEKSSTSPFAVDDNRSPFFHSTSGGHMSMTIQFNDLEKKFIDWDDEKRELMSEYQIHPIFSDENYFCIVDLQAVYIEIPIINVPKDEIH